MVLLWNFPWARICWAILSSQKSVFWGAIQHLEIINSYHRLSACVCLGPIDSPSSQRATQRTSVVLYFRPTTSTSRAWVCTHHSLPFSLPFFFSQMRQIGMGFTGFPPTMRRWLSFTESSQIAALSPWLRHRHGCELLTPTLHIRANLLWPQAATSSLPWWHCAPTILLQQI